MGSPYESAKYNVRKGILWIASPIYSPDQQKTVVMEPNDAVNFLESP